MSFVGDMDADEAEEKLYKLYKKGRLEKGDIFSAFEEVFDQASERQEDSSEEDLEDSSEEAEEAAGEVYDYLNTHHRQAAMDYVQKVGRVPDSYSDEELLAAPKDPKSFFQQVINNTLVPFEEYFQQHFPTVFNEKYWAKWTNRYNVDYFTDRLAWLVDRKDGSITIKPRHLWTLRYLFDPWEEVIKTPLIDNMSDKERMSIYNKMKPFMSGKQQKHK